MRLLLAATALLLIPGLAFGQTKNIDQLSAGGALTGTELLPMFQTANPAVTTTPNAIKTLALAAPLTIAGTIKTTGAEGSQFEIAGAGLTDFKISVGASGIYFNDVTNSKTPFIVAPNTGNSLTIGTGTSAFIGPVTGSSTIGLLDTSAAHYATFGATSSSALTADRAQTWDVANAAHTLALGTAGTKTFPDGTVTLASTAQLPAGANPTATAGATAVNGSAATFMRSDGAPAVAKASNSVFGIVEVDNTTITASAGVISAALPVGANPTATAGATAINGTAATFMRSDGAPALTAASTSTAGIAKLHNVPVSVGWVATVNPNGAVLAVINQASTISAIIGAVETATGTAATVTVNKAASGTACSAGTALHSGTFNANGTAATNQTLTLVGGATDNLAAGDRLCITTTGTTAWTGGTGIGTITVFLAPS